MLISSSAVYYPIGDSVLRERAEKMFCRDFRGKTPKNVLFPGDLGESFCNQQVQEVQELQTGRKLKSIGPRARGPGVSRPAKICEFFFQISGRKSRKVTEI